MAQTNYKKIFLGQDGHKLLVGNTDDFGKYFDWVMIPISREMLIARKNKEIPKTIYLKTDFLPVFVNSIFPSINNEFILVTAASDYSPEVNFNREYNILMNSPKVKFWFMNNMRHKTDKTFSLPTGLGSGVPGHGPVDGWNEEKIDNLILDIRNAADKNKKISDKIFCSFRTAWFQVCGEDMFIRPKIFEIVNNNPNIFENYINRPQMSIEEFIRTLSQYKYALCPHGNGMDPSPTAWLALAVKTTPVIYRTPNVIDMFEGTDSVIYFDKFEEITNKELYVEKQPIDFEFLTCEYWANKIKSKIE